MLRGNSSSFIGCKSENTLKSAISMGMVHSWRGRSTEGLLLGWGCLNFDYSIGGHGIIVIIKLTNQWLKISGT